MTQPKQQLWFKFIALCVVLASYFGYLIIEYDVLTGGIAALLTWSFFVLCTPIADAGFLLDFPLRILFSIRMIVSEVVVWAVAIAINIIALLYFHEMYQTTFLTQTLYVILVTPIPYWAVIVLSGLGTFLSIRFGDELMDALHHKERRFHLNHHVKHELVLFVFFLLVLFGYYEIISSLNLHFDR